MNIKLLMHLHFIIRPLITKPKVFYRLSSMVLLIPEKSGKLNLLVIRQLLKAHRQIAKKQCFEKYCL